MSPSPQHGVNSGKGGSYLSLSPLSSASLAMDSSSTWRVSNGDFRLQAREGQGECQSHMPDAVTSTSSETVLPMPSWQTSSLAHTRCSQNSGSFTALPRLKSPAVSISDCSDGGHQRSYLPLTNPQHHTPHLHKRSSLYMSEKFPQPDFELAICAPKSLDEGMGTSSSNSSGDIPCSLLRPDVPEQTESMPADQHSECSYQRSVDSAVASMCNELPATGSATGRCETVAPALEGTPETHLMMRARPRSSLFQSALLGSVQTELGTPASQQPRGRPLSTSHQLGSPSLKHALRRLHLEGQDVSV